jgi:hypothetical protein
MMLQVEEKSPQKWPLQISHHSIIFVDAPFVTLDDHRVLLHPKK